MGKKQEHILQGVQGWRRIQLPYGEIMALYILIILYGANPVYAQNDLNRHQAMSTYVMQAPTEGTGEELHTGSKAFRTWAIVVSLLLLIAVASIVCLLRRLSTYQTEIARLNETLRTSQLPPPDETEPTKDTPLATGTEAPEMERTEPSATLAPARLNRKDRALFERLTHTIIERQLYLQPDFNKKKLLDEIHVPTNKFAMLFQEFAGCSYTQYIQDLRLEYAIRLMCEQPLWSFEFIAREAHMSESAFYKQFQKKYHMKPSDYRNKMCFSSSRHKDDETDKSVRNASSMRTDQLSDTNI